MRVKYKDRGHELLGATAQGVLIGAGVFAVLFIIVALWRMFV